MSRAWFSGYAYPGLIAGMRARGWEVSTSVEQDWYPRCWGNLAEVPAMSPREYGELLVESARGADLVVLGKGYDTNKQVPGQEAPTFWRVPAEALKRVRDAGAVVVLLTLDDPNDFGFGVQAGLAGAADAVGTCCIGTRPYYQRHGQEHVFEFWPGWDQVLRAPPPRAPVVDLVLVGTPYAAPNPDFGLPRREVALAALGAGATLEVYGPEDWLDAARGGDPALAPHYRGVARWEDLHRVFARGRVAYNSFLRQGFRYLNDRPPTAAGAGAFLLMEQQLGLEGEFPEGTMCGYHARRDAADLAARLRWWLDHEEAREKAARAMQAHVLAHHTWGHRAGAITAAYEAARRRRDAARAAACCGRGGSKN